LAEASPRVAVERLGTSTEGRDFLVAVISSEANMANLDSIRAMTARIADPRGLDPASKQALITDTRAVVFVSCSLHATETAATEFGMQFSWLLATSDEEPFATARDELVVVVIPTVNPDGLDEVVHWYREHVGGPYEGSGLLRLYQLYAGHNNNRDWFALSQVETRHVTEQIYSVWHPQVYWDVHQQGGSRERFFVPPFRDPLNPNLDAGIITAIDALGSRALFDLTREGYTGVSSGVSYDMWWNGGNRNVPVRHNIVGLLTEAASVNIASPVFLEPSSLRPPRELLGYRPSNRFPDPWPGGWWRLSDIIDYELAFARSLLGSVTRERELYLANALEAAERAIAEGELGSPKAWLIPSDNANRRGVRRLVEILILGGVEVFAAGAEFTADGRSWPAGSLVIPRGQPYGSHVKDLFEVQRYPDGPSPYDVAGWTLPILFGVRRVEVAGDFDVPLTPVGSAAEVGWAEPRRAEQLVAVDGDDWARLFRGLAAGHSAVWCSQGEPAGTWTLGEKPEGATVSMDVERLPRLGVYSPWSGEMNEGWLRWVLEDYGLPYVTVRNEMLRAGELAEFLDVLVLPSVRGTRLDEGRAPGSVPDQYTRGLDPEGAVAIEEFVREGGRLVAMQSSAAWAIDLFELPLEDVLRGPDAIGFSCPGSVLRGVPGDGAPAAGLPASQPLFFSGGAAWKVREEQPGEERPEGAIEILLRYAPTRVLYSGWVQEPERIEGQIAWARARHGEGDVHLFGFCPQFRSWSEAAFPLLFRAILL